MSLKKYWIPLAFVAILSAIASWLYPPAFLQSFPVGHHAWAMCDYWAMARRFFTDGIPLWLPRTYDLTTPGGYTASDLPLPAWLGAWVMRAGITQTPLALRGLTLLVSMAGILLFFNALRSAGGPWWRAAAVSILCWLLPGAVFYHAGMLPSAWALACFLMGLWALPRWKWAILCFVLAALIRKPYLLFLLCSFLLCQHPRQRYWWLGGLAVVGAWQVYDAWLMQQYGSLFLRQLMSPRSWTEAWRLVGEIGMKWGGSWLGWPQAIWLSTALGVALYQWRHTGVLGAKSRWLLAMAVAVFGYFVLMMRQFVDHDYYVLDSFYPLIFGAVWCCYGLLGRFRYMGWVELLLAVWALPVAAQRLQWFQRTEGFQVAIKTHAAYAAARPIFDALAVPADARLLVLEAYSTNGPLLLLNRQGYCSVSSRQEVQEKWLDRKPDYVSCLDTNFIAEVVRDYPGIVRRLDFLGRDQQVWLFKLRPDSSGGTLEELLADQVRMLADTTCQTNEEFILSVSLPQAPGEKVLFQGQVKAGQAGVVKPTLALFKAGKLAGYAEKTIQVDTSARRVCLDLQLPGSNADEMRLYWWNPNRLTLNLDTCSIKILQLKPLWRPQNSGSAHPIESDRN